MGILPDRRTDGILVSKSLAGHGAIIESRDIARAVGLEVPLTLLQHMLRPPLGAGRAREACDEQKNERHGSELLS